MTQHERTLLELTARGVTVLLKLLIEEDSPITRAQGSKVLDQLYQLKKRRDRERRDDPCCRRPRRCRIL